MLNSSNTKITDIKFDGDTLYAGDSSKMINIWNWNTGKQSGLNLGYHSGLVYDICVSSKTVLSGGVDNKIVVADKAKIERLLELPHHHKRGVLSLGIYNGSLVSTGGDLLVRMVKLNDIADL